MKEFVTDANNITKGSLKLQTSYLDETDKGVKRFILHRPVAQHIQP